MFKTQREKRRVCEFPGAGLTVAAAFAVSLQPLKGTCSGRAADCGMSAGEDGKAGC